MVVQEERGDVGGAGGAQPGQQEQDREQQGQQEEDGIGDCKEEQREFFHSIPLRNFMADFSSVVKQEGWGNWLEFQLNFQSAST